MSNPYHSEATLAEITEALTRTSAMMWGEARTRELARSVDKVARDITLLLHAKLDRDDPEPYFPALAAGSEVLQ
jgi:hypothetical protein